MNTYSVKTMAATAVAAWCGFNASASVYYTIGGTQNLETFNVTFNDPSINYNFSGSVYAGGIAISQTGTHGPINNSLPLQYLSICTDFKGSLYIGSTYEYSGPVSFAGQTGIDPAWNNAALAIQNAASIFYTHGNLTSGGLGGTVEQMAAVQLAVWMALYDTTDTGSVLVNSSSMFQVTGGADSAAIADALSWVSSLTGQYNYTGQLLTPYPLDSTQGNPDNELPQELLLDPPQGQTPVPEPATVLSGAALLLPIGAGLVRSFRKRKDSTTA